jgi:predicted SnoaL-like aldol condensation-catalyzing enzyme
LPPRSSGHAVVDIHVLIITPVIFYTMKRRALMKGTLKVSGMLECNHRDEADKWLTPEYIQHNPLVVSGRDAVVKFFGSRPKKPTPEKMQTKIVAVVAHGDLVVVAFPREHKDPKDPSKSYTTTWFDMWRISNGKAAEHRDGATKQ